MTRLIAALLCLMAVTGCGNPSYPVKGTVKVDGKPLPDGNITFRPATAGPADPGHGGFVKEGNYEFKAPAGKYRVEISGSRSTGKKDSMGREMTESYIPAKYNAESKLAAEVTSGGPNSFDFDVTLK